MGKYPDLSTASLGEMLDVRSLPIRVRGSFSILGSIGDTGDPQKDAPGDRTGPCGEVDAGELSGGLARTV